MMGNCEEICQIIIFILFIFLIILSLWYKGNRDQYDYIRSVNDTLKGGFHNNSEYFKALSDITKYHTEKENQLWHRLVQCKIFENVNNKNNSHQLRI